MEDYASRKDLNGLGKRLGEIELLKPAVERNAADIQKIFDAMDKIPAQNAAIMKDVTKDNQKTVTKVLVGLTLAVLLMFVKEMVFK